MRRVDPGNLAAVFGEGVRLEAVKLEITEEDASAGTLSSLMVWWDAMQNKQLDGDRYRNTKSANPFANSINTLDFVRAEK